MPRTLGRAAVLGAIAWLTLAGGCSDAAAPEGVWDLSFDLIPFDMKGRLVVPGGDAEGGLLMLLGRPPRQVGSTSLRMEGDTLRMGFATGAELRLALAGDSAHGWYQATDNDTTWVTGVRSDEPPDPALVAALTLRPEGPGAVSVTEQHDGFPVPAGDMLLLTRSSPDWRRHVLLATSRRDGAWGAAAALPFSGGAWSDRGAALSGDTLLVFSSDRALPGDSVTGDWNLWAVSSSAGEWGEPAPLALNSDSADFHPSLDARGNLYFASRRAGGFGAADIWMAPRQGEGWGAPENLGPGINSELSEGSVLVAPDGAWLLVTVTDRPGGYGSDDFWLAERTAGGWGELRNPGPPINSFAAEYGAAFDAATGTLWISSHRRGSADIYTVPVERLGLGGG